MLNVRIMYKQKISIYKPRDSKSNQLQLYCSSKKKKTLKVNFCMLRAENLGYTGLQQAKNVVLSFQNQYTGYVCVYIYIIKSSYRLTHIRGKNTFFYMLLNSTVFQLMKVKIFIFFFCHQTLFTKRAKNRLVSLVLNVTYM